MIRRTLRRLCAAGGGGGEGPGPTPQYDYMTLQRACSIFDYQLNDSFEKKGLKKRFNKLALKHHPDHGGNDKDFQTLLEAHKLLQTHRHDKGGNRFKFHNARRPEQESKSSTTAPTEDDLFGEDTDDHKRFDRFDVLWFAIVASALLYYWMYHLRRINNDLLRTRGRVVEDEMADASQVMNQRHDWHPWGATQLERDVMEEVAVIQGSVTQEVADERAQFRGKLAPSPFTR